VSTGSDSPDFGHDSASLGESINSKTVTINHRMCM
jgi:hypothetical protein